MHSILLIEPDQVLAKHYKKTLETGIRGGAQVERVARAQTALSRLDESSYDVIILELQLGPHNGLEFLYEIRSYSDLRKVPVIIHSAVDPNAITDSPAYQHLEVYRYIRKPARDPMLLLHATQSCIDEQQENSAPES